MLAGYDHLLAAARRLRWDAEAIGLAGDAETASRLPAGERAQLTALVAGFWIAEHAVADELGPYVQAAGAECAARACFATQAEDEARHAHFFDRVAGEVLGLTDPAASAPEAIATLFGTDLPAAAEALAADGDAQTMAAAVGLYHLVLEGIVFAVGQEALHELAGRAGLTGVAEGVARVQGDERWHVGLGVLHLQRLGVAADVSASARRAIAAWGPAVASDERVARVLAAHRRRLQIAGQAPADPGDARLSAPTNRRQW